MSAAGLVTVGVPVRNGERHLGAALASLLGQDVDGLVVVVSDNASTDASAELVADLASGDDRLRLVRRPVDVGANANFNGLVDHCATPYFMWSAADDVRSEGHLAACLAAMDGAGPDAAAVAGTGPPGGTRSPSGGDGPPVVAHGAAVLVDDAGEAMGIDIGEQARAAHGGPGARFTDVLLHEVWCTPVFGLLRADVLRRTALLRPFYGSDKVLLAELALLGRFALVPGATLWRRCHDRQSTVLDARAKRTWAAGRARRRPSGADALAAYVGLAARAPLPPAERARALGGVARLAARPDKFRKAFLPGPYNYFGWRGRSGVGAYDHLGPASTGPDMTSVPPTGGGTPPVPRSGAAAAGRFPGNAAAPPAP
jgi:GT2 family glycosyltransferase